MFALGLGQLALDALTGRTLAHELEEALGALNGCAGEVGSSEGGDGQRGSHRGRE
jgi:hypothetical protein